MINLTYDPNHGLPVRDGEVKDFVTDIIKRHARSAENDPKYTLSVVTGSWLVVAGVLQHVAEAELEKEEVQVTCITATGAKFGPKTPEDDGSITAILNGDEVSFCPTDEHCWMELLEVLTGLSI